MEANFIIIEDSINKVQQLSSSDGAAGFEPLLIGPKLVLSNGTIDWHDSIGTPIKFQICQFDKTKGFSAFRCN